MQEGLSLRKFGLVGVVCAALLAAGCDEDDDDGGVVAPPPAVKTFVGSAQCMACHPRRYSSFVKSGHNFKLNEVEFYRAPTYPFSSIPTDGGSRDVSGTPAVSFDDITYVIGGFGWKARYLGDDGYILTDERTEADLTLTAGDGRGQYNLVNPHLAGGDNWSSYSDATAGSTGKAYTCGSCHTTGWEASTTDHQDDLDGIMGTWDATGVQCEHCHGNGSLHAVAGLTVAESRATITKDRSVELCGKCHSRNSFGQGTDDGAVEASGGFIRHHEQYEELMVSGDHASLTCVDCHDPHTSAVYEDGAGCYASSCHSSKSATMETSHFGSNMAKWSEATGVALDRTDGYSETVTCVSCHMARASKSAIEATDTGVTGTTIAGKIGDLKTHIFRIETSGKDSTDMIETVGTQDWVATDVDGNAAVTMDYACLRCHNDGGNINNPIYTFDLATAAKFAPAMHKGHFDSGDRTPFQLHSEPEIENGHCIRCHGGEAGLAAHLTTGTALTGTLLFADGSKEVVGTGTLFTTELATMLLDGDVVVTDAIKLDSNGWWAAIETITDATHLTLNAYYVGTSGTGVGAAASKLGNVPASRGLTCQTCHNDISTDTTRRTVADVSFPNNNVVDSGDNDMNLCSTCHSGRREMPDYIDGAIAEGDFGLNRAHHHGVGAALYGNDGGGGYEYASKAGTYAGRWMHDDGNGATSNCTYCHEAANTGHTFDVAMVFESAGSKCDTCHNNLIAGTQVEDIRKNATDYDGDGVLAESMKSEIEGLKAALVSAMNTYALGQGKPGLAYNSTSHNWYLDPDGDGVVTDTSSSNRYAGDDYDGKMMKAAYNYSMAEYRVPDSWAHNALYVAQLLVDSIEDLGGDVSAYTWR